MTNVTIANAGVYAVQITNSVGSAVSSNATLTVNLPPTLVRAYSTNAARGRPVVVPITLAANGRENAVTFSLSFDPTLLTYGGIAVGAGAPGATLLPNASQASAGRVGVALGLAAGTTFAAGTQEIVLVTFTAALTPTPRYASVRFGDTRSRENFQMRRAARCQPIGPRGL